MVDISEYKDAPLFSALIELNEKLKETNAPKIELNVVGGFALMIKELRDPLQFTDIDYIGKNLPKSVKSIAADIGINKNLGSDWINNDLMLSGTSLEDLEFSTGKLHFYEAFDMEKVKINVIDTKDLLRMKVISIDTAITAVELGGEFTREKDMADIALLMDRLNLQIKDVRDMTGEFLLNEKTMDFVEIYEKAGRGRNGLSAVREEIQRVQYENLKAKFEKGDENDRGPSPMIDAMLSAALARAREDGPER